MTPPVAEQTGANGDFDERRLAALELRVSELARTVEYNRLVRDGWTLFIFLIAAVAIVASIVAVGFGLRAIDEAEQTSGTRGARGLPETVPLPSYTRLDDCDQGPRLGVKIDLSCVGRPLGTVRQLPAAGQGTALLDSRLLGDQLWGGDR